MRVGGLLRRAFEEVRGHPRLAGVGVGSALASLGAVLVRRRMHQPPALPDPAGLASLTAVSVHNAAKGSVISAVRAAETPDGSLIPEAVRRAVAEAASAGVDIAPAAIGAVEGAVEVAHVAGEDGLAAGRSASVAAVDAAYPLGTPAVERLRELLAPYLELDAARESGPAAMDEDAPEDWGVSPDTAAGDGAGGLAVSPTP